MPGGAAPTTPCARLQDRAAAHGALVQFGVGPATVSERDDGVVARCVDLEVVARAAVITAGSWVERVAPGGIGLPAMKVTQEQIVHFPPRADGEWPSFIHHRVDAGDGVVYGLRTPREGIKVGGHHAGPVTDPDRRTFELDARGSTKPCVTPSSGSPESSPFQCSA